jgi:EXS family
MFLFKNFANHRKLYSYIINIGIKIKPSCIEFFFSNHHQVATIAWFEADSICGSHSVVIPMVLVFPYLCRFFQCLRQYKDTKEKSCLFNGNNETALAYKFGLPKTNKTYCDFG